MGRLLAAQPKSKIVEIGVAKDGSVRKVGDQTKIHRWNVTLVDGKGNVVGDCQVTTRGCGRDGLRKAADQVGEVPLCPTGIHAVEVGAGVGECVE